MPDLLHMILASWVGVIRDYCTNIMRTFGLRIKRSPVPSGRFCLFPVYFFYQGIKKTARNICHTKIIM